MPGFDRRGPSGEGPITGRGLGKCGENGGTSRGEKDVLNLGKCDFKMHRGRNRNKTDKGENKS